MTHYGFLEVSLRRAITRVVFLKIYWKILTTIMSPNSRSLLIQYDYYDYVIDETSKDVLAYNSLTEEWT